MNEGGHGCQTGSVPALDRSSILLDDEPLTVARATRRGWQVVQWFVMGFLVLEGVDTMIHQDAWTAFERGEYLALCIFYALLVWRPVMFAPAALALLAISFFHFPGGVVFLPLFLLPVLLFWRLTQRAAIVLGLIMVCYIPLARMASLITTYAGISALVLMVASACIIGWVIRMIMMQRRLGDQRIRELELENARIRSDERSALARELHDVVAHQLSVISLQIMGHRDSDDPEELRQALDRVDEASGSALTELQLLLEVLRDDDPTDTREERMAEVLPPTRVAAQVAETLVEAGHHVRVQVADNADALEASQQLTISRVLQEAGTNILRHAPAGSQCDLAVEVFPRKVVVDVRSPLSRAGAPKALDKLSLGYGLRGIRERADLVGGALQVGPDGPDWVVHLALPRGASRHPSTI